MDPIGSFEVEIASFLDEQENQRWSSDGYKAVPWLSWDEWDSVRDSLFSSSPDRVSSALQRISTWRARGCVPAAVDVTASIVEIQQKDGFIMREKQPINALHSEHLLQLLYCMAILRLVNCVIEKTRRRTEVSIGEAAEAIGIPRKLIDLRHEGSHRELPALSVLREAADEALDWLKSYYWEPQKNQIPFKKDGTANIRKEVKSKLRKLAFCLQLRQNPQLGSPLVKERCSRKRIRKILNVLAQLYSSFSTEVVSVLLDCLLKALDSSNWKELPKGPEFSQDLGGLLDEWKLVIVEFSNIEPELLLTLLQAVLDKIRKDCGAYETGYFTSESKKSSRVENLPFLFAWLVANLKGLKLMQHAGSLGINASNKILMELLRECLLLSATSNGQLVDSALQLAELMGGNVWRKKLEILPWMHMSPLDVLEQSSPLLTPESLMEQEESIRAAAKKLEIVKQKLLKKSSSTKEADAGISKRWVKTETWNPCPIGMLPRILGSSGCLPVLGNNEVHEKAHSFSQTEESWGMKQCKRQRDCDINEFDNSSVKRAREMAEYDESGGEFDTSLKSVVQDKQPEDGSSSHESVIQNLPNPGSNDDKDLAPTEGGRGCLMIGGAWKRVGEEDVLAIASAVRILV